MNKLIKLLSISLLFYSMNVISADNSTLLLSQAKGGYSIDFLNSDNITALQFDVKMSGISEKSVKLNSCISGLPSTHTGTCQIKNGIMRVVIYSTSNSVLDSGNIGNIKLTGNLANNIVIDKVVMGTADLKNIQGEVMIDVDRKNPFLGDSETLK